MKNKFCDLKIQTIRELPKIIDFLIHIPGTQIKSMFDEHCTLSNRFTNTSTNTQNTLLKTKSKLCFLIVNVARILQENDVKEEMLKNKSTLLGSKNN